MSYRIVLVLTLGIVGWCFGEECNDGDIRFYNVSNSSSLLLQICTRTKWTYISYGNWRMDDAGIACQQMGNYTHNSSGVLQVTLQTSISSVYMSNFDCNHNEGLGNNLLKDCKSEIGNANTKTFATASCIEAGKDSPT
jgi:hypothetical protein